MRRRFLFALALASLLAFSSTAAGKPAGSWAQAEINAVLAAGLMGDDPATFRPNDALTRGALEDLVAALTQVEPVPPATPAAKVTMAGLDARLVRALELTDAAKLFLQGAKGAGLAPPARFGTETVSRLLGLRTNHPAAQDDLELSPNEPATRAETAYSAAQILRFGDWSLDSLNETAATFSVPTLTPWQQRILAKAASLIGYPYVWGGESESKQSPYGPQAHGGFDCSGFVWRVYKLQHYPGATRLPGVLKGRTTYAMSGEVGAAKRIALADLQPADLLFFGAKGPRSKPAQVDHMAIYLGNGWFIQSSRYGVALATLDGSYGARFAWGRRPLAEAGLSLP